MALSGGDTGKTFQSTPSAWRETYDNKLSALFQAGFQSTPSAWRETQPVLHGIGRSRYFNPLPPHGGRRCCRTTTMFRTKFQSTPSAWRETDPATFPEITADISIHSLRMEGDWSFASQISTWKLFQSTPSAWRETFDSSQVGDGNVTFQSTPSAWRETSRVSSYAVLAKDFNPLPPHGGRRCLLSRKKLTKSFQSTPSAWRETCFEGNLEEFEAFQSTPSAWRETCRHRSLHGNQSHFNPLPPHGGRLTRCLCFSAVNFISIHSLRMEGDS